uniref:Saposin B-type domain-containing protein n=1 Tax=Steinernema glaseri TaxID=37863 RepID=A0A1I7Z6W5_9BILA
MSFDRAVVFSFAFLSLVSQFLPPAAHCEERHRLQLRNSTSAFHSVFDRNCLNSIIPCVVCGTKLMDIILKDPETGEAIDNCEEGATLMFGRVMRKFTNRCASTVKKTRRMGKREVDDTSQKAGDELRAAYIRAGYMNTINVTNLEKFLRMQIMASKE